MNDLSFPHPVPTLAPAPLIAARNDTEAASEFLHQRNAAGEARFSTTTLANYDKEIRRLLFYCHQEDFGFHDLSVAHVQSYTQWLRNPPELLLGNARRSAEHPDWKPFARALSPTSVNQSIAVIKSLFSWLCKVGYLKRNVFALLSTSTREYRQATAARKERALMISDIRAILDYLRTVEPTLPPSTDLRRLQRQRWLFHGYLYSGLRISELLNIDTGALQSQSMAETTLWTLDVTGKGGRPARLPVSSHFIREFSRYRKALGHAALPTPSARDPFIYDLKGRHPLKSRQAVHESFKDLAHKVAAIRETQGHYLSAERIRASSTHWLRHSFVSIALDASNDLPAVSELARHGDINTTLQYDKSEYLHLARVLNDVARQIDL